jgi:hypothetical protein
VIKPDNQKIYLLWSTVRPHNFKETHHKWIESAQSKHKIITKVVVDTEEEKEILEGYDVVVSNSPRPGICYPITLLTRKLVAKDNDIIVLASDDFFSPLGWDTFIVKQLHGECAVLIVDDGFMWKKCCVAIPIMTYSALLKLNKIIYHPAYYHFCSDDELYDNAAQLGILKDLRCSEHMIFEHQHYTIGKREEDQYDRVVKDKSRADYETYCIRKNLPLTKRLET